MEWWVGWFNHWGDGGHGRRTPLNSTTFAEIFRNLLNSGASVNQYMFSGGTSFGFMSGTNWDWRTKTGIRKCLSRLKKRRARTSKAVPPKIRISRFLIY